MGVATEGGDVTCAIENHFTAIATDTALTAHGEVNGRTFTDAPGDAESSVSAAAADALGQDTVGVLTGGFYYAADRRLFGAHGHLAPQGTATAFTTYAGANFGALSRDTAGDAEPTGTPASAHALGKYPVRVTTAGGDVAFSIENHFIAVASCPAFTTQTEVDGRGFADAAGDTEAAVTAAAADALGEDAV